MRICSAQLDEPGCLTVVVIEDLHWADESTFDLVRFLGRRVRTMPVLLLVTFRDDSLQPDDSLRIVLGELATQRSTRRVSFAPLSEAAVGTLAADCALAPAELFRLTGGNPFVTEVLQTGSSQIPPSARDAVLARVAQLSASARRAVEAAALIGAHVEPTLLEAVLVATPADLDELVGSAILVSNGAGVALPARTQPARRRGRGPRTPTCHGAHAGAGRALRPGL